MASQLPIFRNDSLFQKTVISQKFYFQFNEALLQSSERVTKLLTGQENGSQKGITEREFFGYQNNLPKENLAIKYSYQTYTG